MKPLFFIGNKRSGTSHLRTLLNDHPEIYVCFEQDLAWILYQCRNGETRDFVGHRHDTPYGMWHALWESKNYNIFCAIENAEDRREAIRAAFFESAQNLFKWRYPDITCNLKWIGDKKPVQNAEPSVFNFIADYFPEARFVHLIRHPAEVVGSIQSRTGYKLGPRFWYYERDEILAMWAEFEMWVMKDKEVAGDRIIDVRYEDLCRDPGGEMERIFTFLDLEPLEPLLFWADTKTKSPDHGYDMSVPDYPALKKVMKEYGYA